MKCECPMWFNLNVTNHKGRHYYKGGNVGECRYSKLVNSHNILMGQDGTEIGACHVCAGELKESGWEIVETVGDRARKRGEWR